jgi:signal transduction histidine kinase
MPTKTIKRRSMLWHWTLRYVITLCLGLLLIGVISVLWIQQTNLNSRLQLLQLLANELADKVAAVDGSIAISPDFPETIDSRQRFFHIPDQVSVTITDTDGKVMFYKPTHKLNNLPKDAPPIAKDDPNQANDEYSVTAFIVSGNTHIGTVSIGQSKQSLSKINQQYSLLAALLGGIGLLGWLIIYLILRKLTKPIMDIASAAKKIEDGNYLIELQENVKEKEIYDLLLSFKGMAIRLEQLEDLRTELLAGVTHELKTPITSISGLIHAVRDQVVTGAEAKEFLDISIKETQRLQQMVSGLLDFNSFASGKIHVERERLDLGKLLNEITYQWGLTYQNESLELITHLPNQTLYAQGDAGRIQQIIVNLLNNSRQAIAEKGQIKVTLIEDSQTWLTIHVTDNGSGIPASEQINVFERYYRGGNKKLAVHGLGLGLTFSKMLTTAMGGTLTLLESSPAGTTFELCLPRD